MNTGVGTSQSDRENMYNDGVYVFLQKDDLAGLLSGIYSVNIVSRSMLGR
jgi:hypothetical protein